MMMIVGLILYTCYGRAEAYRRASSAAADDAPRSASGRARPRRPATEKKSLTREKRAPSDPRVESSRARVGFLRPKPVPTVPRVAKPSSAHRFFAGFKDEGDSEATSSWARPLRPRGARASRGRACSSGGTRRRRCTTWAWTRARVATAASLGWAGNAEDAEGYRQRAFADGRPAPMRGSAEARRRAESRPLPRAFPRVSGAETRPTLGVRMKKASDAERTGSAAVVARSPGLTYAAWRMRGAGAHVLQQGLVVRARAAQRLSASSRWCRPTRQFLEFRNSASDAPGPYSSRR